MSKELRGHGTVYKRGNVFWIQYLVHGRVYRESSGSPDRNVALKKLKGRVGEASHGVVIGPVAEKVTLGHMRDALLTDYRLRENRSLSTAEHFADNLVDYFGEDARALDITPERIEKYAQTRQEQGMANASINRETSCLRHMFVLMVKARRLSRDHVPAVPRLEESAPRRGFLEPAEFAGLRAALPDYLRNPVTFLYLTGWRKSAMRTLEWMRDTELERDKNGDITGGHRSSVGGELQE